MCQQTQIITVKSLAVFPVERPSRDRRASSKRGRPSKSQRNKEATSCSSSASTKNNQNMSFGLVVLWIILVIIAIGLYFLTRIDLPNYHSPTSINETTKNTKILTAAVDLDVFSKGGMYIGDAVQLKFLNDDGTCMNIKVQGALLTYEGGEGTKHARFFAIDGVPLDETNLMYIPCPGLEQNMRSE